MLFSDCGEVRDSIFTMLLYYFELVTRHNIRATFSFHVFWHWEHNFREEKVDLSLRGMNHLQWPTDRCSREYFTNYSMCRTWLFMGLFLGYSVPTTTFLFKENKLSVVLVVRVLFPDKSASIRTFRYSA